MNYDFKYIKKHYSEKFAQDCRRLFPTILEKEGMLANIISSNFAPSKHLHELVENNETLFRNYIFNVANIEQKIMQGVSKTPEQLFQEAGYILYPECESDADVQAFKKYYELDEKLCTFDDHTRIDNCRIWFAVKEDVDKIKRKDFLSPERQDAYGTSVLSIQFTKSIPNILSIKNRYNHRVANPDCTFSNNLDNIRDGLTASFIKYFGINPNFKGMDVDKEMFQNYILANDGVFYRYNLVIGDRYFCENNIVVDYSYFANGEAVEYDKSRYLLVDQYLFDFSLKRIDRSLVDIVPDAFISSIGRISDMKVVPSNDEEKTVIITPQKGDDVKVVVSSKGELVEYYNPNAKTISDGFLFYNLDLRTLDLPNVRKIGDECLTSNRQLKVFNAPHVKCIGDRFLENNIYLEEFRANELVKAGYNFLTCLPLLKVVELKNLRRVSEYSLSYNPALKVLNVPNLKLKGEKSLVGNKIAKIKVRKGVKEIPNKRANSRDYI